MGFSKQEYWSGLPFPSPGIFQTQGLNPHLLCLLHLLEGSLPLLPPSLVVLKVVLGLPSPFLGNLQKLI